MNWPLSCCHSSSAKIIDLVVASSVTCIAVDVVPVELGNDSGATLHCATIQRLTLSCTNVGLSVDGATERLSAHHELLLLL